MDFSDTDLARLVLLAERLDCLTEEDLMLLTDAAPATTKTWRKRGEGPGYIRAGNRYLYPREEVAKWLNARAHLRKADAKGQL